MRNARSRRTTGGPRRRAHPARLNCVSRMCDIGRTATYPVDAPHDTAPSAKLTRPLTLRKAIRPVPRALGCTNTSSEGPLTAAEPGNHTLHGATPTADRTASPADGRAARTLHNAPASKRVLFPIRPLTQFWKSRQRAKSSPQLVYLLWPPTEGETGRQPMAITKWNCRPTLGEHLLAIMKRVAWTLATCR